jgi:hypothetical protein
VEGRDADDAGPLADLRQLRLGRVATNVVRRHLTVLGRATLLIAALVAAATAGIAIASTSSPSVRASPACGVERWDVKTLQDPAGRALNLSAITQTTVAALRAKPVVRGPGSSRGAGVESTFYEVRSRLVGAKLEDDGDIHLVIRGLTTSGTMIVEFPQVPSCTGGATTGARTRMKNARNAFVAACGTPGASFTSLTGKATLRGIGFFDFLHGQTGVAPNGIELHPVLKFMNATC